MAADRSAAAGSQRGRFAERDREDRPVAVNDVEREDERDLQARLFDSRTLENVHLRRPSHVQGRAEQSLSREVQVFVTVAAIGLAVELLELAELLLDRHPRQERFDAAFEIGADLRGGRRAASETARAATASPPSHRRRKVSTNA